MCPLAFLDFIVKCIRGFYTTYQVTFYLWQFKLVLIIYEDPNYYDQPQRIQKKCRKVEGKYYGLM